MISYLREEIASQMISKQKGFMTLSWKVLEGGKEEFYFWEGEAHTHRYLDNVPCNKIAFLDEIPVLIITDDFKEKLPKTDLFCFKNSIFSHFKVQTIGFNSFYGYIRGGGQRLILQGEKVLFAIHDQ